MPNQAAAVALSDGDMDAILSSVEQALANVPNLNKSASSMQNQMHKDERDPNADPEATPADNALPPADTGEGGAPAVEAAPSDNAEAPAGSEDLGQASPQNPDAQIQAEAGNPDDAPLSDEELDQIYGGMEQDELMRHYAAIRAHLERQMGDQAAAAGAPQQAPADPAMGMAAKAEMEAAGGSGSTLADINAAANKPKDEPSGGAGSPAGSLGKSEVARLEAKIAQLQKAHELQLQAIEIITCQPTRKAITGLDFIRKNEELENGAQGGDLSNLTKSEIDSRFREMGPAKLDSAERQTVNNYLLNNEGKDKVLGILKSKGGK